MSGKLIEDPEDALDFVLAGKARVTLKSKATGKHFSYLVQKNESGNVYFVKALMGPDNTSDYRYIGHVSRGAFHHGKDKAAAGSCTATVVAFRWTYVNLINSVMPKSLEVWHEGQCGRCGRALTDPESIARGLGPVCAEAGN